jgi:hypothetical protein
MASYCGKHAYIWLSIPYLLYFRMIKAKYRWSL